MLSELITILGPTAVGKTQLGSELAYHYDGEIISADSRQVYRGMDLGTGKDLADYVVSEKSIPYHLIDIMAPTEEFNLFEFTQKFDAARKNIVERNKSPFLVGGTGLYIHSILKGYNLQKMEHNQVRKKELEKLSLKSLNEHLIELKPNLHNKTDLVDKHRTIQAIMLAESLEDKSDVTPISSIVIGVRAERDIIKKRITNRLKVRLKDGMIEEVETLLSNGVTFEKLNFFGLEYKFLGQYLNKEITYNDMFQKLNSAIHKFAKRQMTWFRKMEKEGIRF